MTSWSRHCRASRRPTPSCASTTSTRSSTAATPRSRARWGSSPAAARAHEPLHGGFVGLGMLDAACAGEVFTSPVPEQMLAATKLVDGGAGVLHVVEELHGRRDELRHGRRAGGRRRPGAGVVSGGHRRRRGRPGQHRGRRVVVGSVSPCCSRRSPGRRPSRAAASTTSPTSPQGQRPRPEHGGGAHLMHRSGRRQADVRSSARPRWSSVIGHPRRAGPGPAAPRASVATSPRCWSSRSWRDLPLRPGRLRASPSSTGSGGTPLIEACST